MSWDIPVPEPSASHEQPPPGTHAAVCVACIDLGLHEQTYQGQTYTARQLLLAWELTACRMSGSTATHVVAKQYTASLAEKANLRRLLKGWFGRDISPGQAFDPRKLLGKRCLLNLVQSKNGKHVQIDGASQLPAGMPCNPATRELFARHTDDEDTPIPDWVPWLYGSPVADVIAARLPDRAGAAPPPAREPATFRPAPPAGEPEAFRPVRPGSTDITAETPF